MKKRFEIWTNDNDEKYMVYGDHHGNDDRDKLKAQKNNARVLHMFYALTHVDAMNYFHRYIGKKEEYVPKSPEENKLFKD